jgi:hypothetical protein
MTTETASMVLLRFKANAWIAIPRQLQAETYRWI